MSDHYRTAVQHYQAGRFDRAQAACETFLRDHADAVEGWNLLGAIAMARGDLEAAGEALSRAVKLAPENAEVHNNLAAVMSRLGRHDEALKWSDEATRLKPEFADAFFNKGIILGQLSRFADAAAAYEQLCALAPDHVRGWHNLGIAQARLGRMEEARESFARALELDPDNASAWYDLSQIHVPDEAGLCAEIEDRIGRTGNDPKAAMLLHFAAGRLRDRLGEHDRAFAHFDKANALRGADFKPDQIRVYVDQLLQTFTRDFFSPRRGWGLEDETPVFIVGMPRSGTTLVEQILAAHPRVFGAGELNDLQSITWHMRDHAKGNAPYPVCLPDMNRTPIEGFAKAYRRRLEEISGGGFARITDKMPLNILQVGLIHLMFPKAHIVHVRRDPLDTCLSCYFQYFTYDNEFAYDLSSLGFFYGEYARLCAHWETVLPGRMIEVRYERLTAEPESEARALIERLGLDWDPACLAFAESERGVRTASVAQVREPVHTRSIGRWRRYADHLQPLIEALPRDIRKQATAD